MTLTPRVFLRVYRRPGFASMKLIILLRIGKQIVLLGANVADNCMIVRTRRTRRPDCKSELPSWRALSARCVHVAYGTRAVADSSILAAEEQAASSMGPAWNYDGQLPFSSQSISGRIRSGDFAFSRRAFPGLLCYTAEVPNNTRAHPHLSLRDARGAIWPLCRSFVWAAVPTQHPIPSGPFTCRSLRLSWRGCAQLHARRGV